MTFRLRCRIGDPAAWRPAAAAYSAVACGLLLGGLAAGCSPGTVNFSDSIQSDRPSVEAADSQAAEKAVTAFVSAAQSGDGARMRQEVSTAFQPQLQPTPGRWLGQEKYKPLGQASGLQFTGSQYMARGKKLISRAEFHGPDGSLFHVNFVLARSNDGHWLIDSVVPPSKVRKPVSANAGQSAAPAH